MKYLAVMLCASLAFAATSAAATPAWAAVPAPLPDPVSTPIDPSQSSAVPDSWTLTPESTTVVAGVPGRTELSYAAERGAAIRDAVTLSNFTDMQQTFRLYGADAVNNVDGRIEYRSGEQLSGDVGSWVTFAQDSVVVAAHTQTMVAFEIRIPSEARSGDHVGAVFASNESLASDPGKQVVTIDRRVSTRLIMRVAGDTVVDISVSKVHTTYRHALNPAGGVGQVSFDIQNRGNVRVVGAARATLKGPFGVGQQTVSVGAVPELLPGQQITMTADVAHVAAAMMIYTSVAVEASRVTDLGVLQVANGTARTFAPPVSVLLGVLIVLVAAIVLRMRRRKSAAPPPTI